MSFTSESVRTLHRLRVAISATIAEVFVPVARPRTTRSRSVTMPTTRPLSTIGTAPQSLSRIVFATLVIESFDEQKQGFFVMMSAAFI
jgi:hypothetical protein